MKKLFTFFLFISIVGGLCPQSSIVNVQLQAGYTFSSNLPGIMTKKGYIFPYVAGNDTSFNYSNNLAYLDSSGMLIWDKTVYVNGSNDGNVEYIMGYGADESGIYLAFVNNSGLYTLLGMDFSGNVNWSKTWMGDSTSYLEGVHASGGYIYVTFQEYSSGVNHRLVKLDVSGNIVWQRESTKSGI